MTQTNPFTVEIVATTAIRTAAAALAPGAFSAAISVPTLNAMTPRLDPFNPDGQDWPDCSGGTATHGSDMTRAWIWFSKACWYPAARAAVFTNSPHPFDEFGPPGPGNLTAPGNYNAYITTLSVFREPEHTFTVHEAPISNQADRSNPNVWPRGVAHGFDNQCIVGDTLYKCTHPVFLTGTGYVQPQVVKFDLKKLRPDVESAREAAAYAGSFALYDNDLTAGALDYLPGCDALVHYHKTSVAFYPFSGAGAGAWSAPVALGFTTTTAIHNLGHYHPNVGKFICGGGSIAPTTYNLQFVAIDGTSKAITALDNAPVTLSVNETALSSPVPVAFREGKACATYAPTSTESLYFHQTGTGTGTVYALDTTRAPGQHWRTVGPWSGHPVDWVCPIADYGVILCGCFAPDGASVLRLYKPPLLPDIQPPTAPTGLAVAQ